MLASRVAGSVVGSLARRSVQRCNSSASLVNALRRVPYSNMAKTNAPSLTSRNSLLRVSARSYVQKRGFASEVREFQAETRKLLDIVARSLYTDKEVFVRELVSNSSDALEKFKQFALTSPICDPELEPAIDITTDNENNTLTISDNGIGMTKEDLIQYLGTIAKSGSAEFMKKITETSAADVSNIIGQFGVGFYSVFMVGKNVQVYTKHAAADSKGFIWTSDGSGSYEISEAPEGEVTRGTKIVIHLKEDEKTFSSKEEIAKIIKKYSNFVGYPIRLNDEEVNTVKAIWMLPKDKVSEDDHKEFYRFISHAFDTPTYHLHYSADAPVSINSLFYFPTQHSEKYGMARTASGISLYSRKVLIQSHTKLILPEWLRFVKGVVDSADIPLNLSREHLQDSALIKRLSTTVTRRLLKFLQDEMRTDRPKYERWFAEFSPFIREGLCTDFQWKDELGKLFLTESSALKAGELTSLEEYVARMKPDQKEIYWLAVPSRALAETSPYYESFKESGTEVLFLHYAMDDFVMTHLGEYQGKRLVSIENAAPKEKTDDEIKEREKGIEGLRTWIKDVLHDKVSAVKTSSRLVSSPAVIVDHESANFRRMVRMIDPTRSPKLPKQILEINPTHPLIINLNLVRNTQPDLAKVVVEQLFDNALITAGLMEDPRIMVPRLNSLLTSALTGAKEVPSYINPEPHNPDVVENIGIPDLSDFADDTIKEEPKKQAREYTYNAPESPNATSSNSNTVEEPTVEESTAEEHHPHTK